MAEEGSYFSRFSTVRVLIISYDLPLSFSKIIQFFNGIFSLLFLYIFYPIFDIFSRFFLILVVFLNDFITKLDLRWTFLRITSDMLQTYYVCAYMALYKILSVKSISSPKLSTSCLILCTAKRTMKGVKLKLSIYQIMQDKSHINSSQQTP